MVSKLTLFEPHLEGAQFGPSTIDNEVTDGMLGQKETKSPGEVTERTGRKPGRVILVQGLIGLGFVLLVLFASRKLLQSGDQE